jgi:hypothetical protein
MSENLPAVLQGMDLSQYSEEERREIIEFYKAEMAGSKEGVDLRPSRIKISKDTLQFMDEMGNTTKELTGVIVYKQKARGYWDRDSDDKMPVCSSINGIIGIQTEDGAEKKCADCPYNQWRSAIDDSGNPARGKACKEMRRVFLLQKGSALPVVLTLPPTSITEFDKYISARISRGLADIATETVFTLTAETGGKFTYAKIQCSTGAPVPPHEMMRIAKMRNDIQAAAQRMAVADDD